MPRRQTKASSIDTIRLERAASQGNVAAQIVLAREFLNGKNVTKDESKAAEYFRMAAGQENIQAMVNLGVMCANGEGVAKDIGMAVEYFLKAAAKGNPKARSNLKALVEKIFSLGVNYAEGIEGVVQNNQKAMKYFRIAANIGCVRAQHALGGIYLKGLLSVDRNMQEAKKWYNRAAGQGCAEAMIELGAMYANGEGAAKDIGMAVEYFLKAAAKGNTEAQSNLKDLVEQIFRLGLSHVRGTVGVAQNNQKAMKYFQVAADIGHVLAQYALGEIYLKGQLSVNRNMQEAKKWYNRAAGQGLADAKQALRECQQSESTEACDKPSAQLERGFFGSGEHRRAGNPDVYTLADMCAAGDVKGREKTVVKEWMDASGCSVPR